MHPSPAQSIPLIGFRIPRPKDNDQKIDSGHVVLGVFLDLAKAFDLFYSVFSATTASMRARWNGRGPTCQEELHLLLPMAFFLLPFLSSTVRLRALCLVPVSF